VRGDVKDGSTARSGPHSLALRLSSPTPATPAIRLGRNAGLNLLGHGLPLVVALAAMPVVVRGLGPARFGLLALAWTLVSYVGVFDLGFGRAATKRVSEAAWLGDGGQVRRLATTVVTVQAVLGAATGGLLWVLSAPVAALLVADATLQSEGAVMLALLGLAVPAVLVSNSYRSVLEGLHRFDLVNLARAPLSAAIFAVSAGGVLVGAGLPAIVLALVVTRYIGAGVHCALYYRAAPPGPGGFDAGALGALLRFGGWVAVSNTLVPIGIYLERFVVSGIQGPAALAYYTAPQELVLKLHLLPTAVTGVLFPAFSGLSARGERAELLKQIRRGTKLVALLLAVPVAVLIAMAEPLLTLWLGADYGRLSSGVLRVLAPAVFLNGLAFIPFVLAEGIGKPALVAKYHAVELPLYAAALWFFTVRFGIMGTAVVWAARMAVMAPGLYILVIRHAGVTLAEPLRGSTGATIASALLLFAGVELMPLAAPAGPAPRLAAIALVAAFVWLAWRRLLDAEDRDALGALWARAVRRPR
jgi:O-antigen/teichoic acid export membrane protein